MIPDPSASRPPNRGGLLTEQRNPASAALDALDTPAILDVINSADAGVAPAVRAQIGQIAAFTDHAVDALAADGRLVYLGAGTSGRLGVLDASECPPTFQTDSSQIIGLIAGGEAALRRSSEHKEDFRDGAVPELEGLEIGTGDAVLGIAAGGTTPYVLGGVEHAKSRGARTGMLVCTPMDRPAWCDVLIVVETGPEVIAGSTRLKAGTATKMVLNMISTAAMVRLGKTYADLMVDLRATNDKLADRAARIVSALTGLDREQAFALLDRAGGRVKVAAVMHERGVDSSEAIQLLDGVDWRLRAALDERERDGPDT